MTKVTVLMKNGQLKTMSKRYADALVSCRKAIYADSYQKKVIEPKSYNVKSDQDELQKAREQYQKIVGKKPFHGWGVEQLMAKIKGNK